MALPTNSSSPTQSPSQIKLELLSHFKPDLYKRAWSSVPHPRLPLIATTHDKEVTLFSLSTLSKHSTLTGGHTRSVRCATWKPGLPPHRLCLVTGSFDSSAALWRWAGDVPFESEDGDGDHAAGSAADTVDMEIEVTSSRLPGRRQAAAVRVAEASPADSDSDRSESGRDDWSLELVLEGHESEIKGAAFSPSGQYLATCSRDKSVWIWEDVGASETDDEWETVAVLNEHDGDVKCVAWCPDVPGRTARGRYSADVLASACYDNTVRVWREDGDGEWVCVAVLEGHEGTVWGLQWEPAPSHNGFPRLLTYSADTTIRVWTLREEDKEEAGQDGVGGHAFFGAGLGGIPNTMRRSIREDWECTAVLPSAHTRDVYSASWSAATGLVASTGSDGVVAVFAENAHGPGGAGPLESSSTLSNGAEVEPEADADAEANAELDGEDQPAPAMNGNKPLPTTVTNGATPSASTWRLLTKVANAHGPYEVNHVTWCRRFDHGTERKGEEEMLVTTGDDGIVRAWKVIS